MGGCLGTPRRVSYPERDSSEISGGVSIGRNQPLRRDCPKWKSDVPITDDQLRMRRDEFWDTAPVFEGHREIWDALKVASVGIETGDFDLAQAIIDGAGISLPNGTLSDCYDELGTRYQLPSYVLSKPTNLLTENETKTGEKQKHLASSSSCYLEKPKDHKSSSGNRGSEILVKLQLSTGKELKATVRTTDPILRLKEFVSQSENIPPSKQRMFFAGAELQNRVKVKEARIKKNYVVQVVVPTAEVSEEQKGRKNDKESTSSSSCTKAAAPKETRRCPELEVVALTTQSVAVAGVVDCTGDSEAGVVDCTGDSEAGVERTFLPIVELNERKEEDDCSRNDDYCQNDNSEMFDI